MSLYFLFIFFIMKLSGNCNYMHQDYMYQDDEWLLSERGRYVFLKVSYGGPVCIPG